MGSYTMKYLGKSGFKIDTKGKIGTIPVLHDWQFSLLSSRDFGNHCRANATYGTF